MRARASIAAVWALRESNMSLRIITIFVTASLLGGCGLAEVGAGAAANGAAAAEQAKAGQQQMEKVQADVDAAQKAAADARVAAEAASE